MSSRVWNIISLISFLIIAIIGVKMYVDGQQSRMPPLPGSVSGNTPEYAPSNPKSLVAVAQTKVLSAKQQKRLKKLWKNCNNIDVDKRLKGCDKVIKSGLEKEGSLLLAYNNRASAYGEKEKYPQAIRDYSFIIEQDPDNFEAFMSRGDIWQISNRFDKAIDDYTTAITIKKNDHTPYFSRAWAHYQMDKVNAGLLDLNKAIKINDSDSELYAARGQFYETIGRDKDAAKNYRLSLKLNPSLVESLDGLKRTGKGGISAKNKKKK